MKNYLIVFILGLFLASCASPKREISRSIDEGSFKEAQEQLNLLLEEEGAKEDPEVWLLKADFYMHLFDSELPEHQELADDPLSKAYDAIQKAEELDEANVHMLEIQQKRLVLSEQIFNLGLQYYEASEFSKASERFYSSYIITEQLEATDTMTLFNAALAAEQGGVYDKAQKYYKRLIDMQLDEPYIYLGVANTFLNQREKVSLEAEKYDAFIKAYDKKGRIDSIISEVESIREVKSILSYELDAHTDIVELVLEEKPYEYDDEKINAIRKKYESLVEKLEQLEENSITYLRKGRELYPEDIDLIFGKANFYLLAGKTAEAKDILDLAIEKDPDNPSLHFAFGANFEKMADDEMLTEEEREMAFDEAVEAYERAIELDDEYVDAYYNLGALYFNEGIKIFEEAEEELRETRDFRQYQKAEEKIAEMWLKAQPYMEKAKELIEPQHPMYRAIVTSLFQLYARTDQKEKQEEIQSIYQELYGHPGE